jgi:DUF2934 family protein
MKQAYAMGLNSKDLDFLNKIEELRSHLLVDQKIREQISRRAYELYERRGGEPGRDVEDWIQAENEILSPLIEEQIPRAAKPPQAETSNNPEIASETVPTKKAKPLSGVTQKGSAESAESHSKIFKSSKKKSDGKSKGKKKKAEQKTPLADLSESNELGNEKEGNEPG